MGKVVSMNVNLEMSHRMNAELGKGHIAVRSP
jgi:hypothetical protein